MYIPKDQRLYENLKVPGYETPEKSDTSYKKLNEQKRVANHLKQQWGIAEKHPRKVIVQHTETKSETKAPELTGVDRYILAKK
jgi:hypothetical protein